MHNDLTLKDIARIANVSVATVSRVLNNLGGYSEETRKKIIKVIDEYGYRRNAAARNLKTKKSNTIAVLLPQVETTYYITILNGIGDAAQQNGYSVLVCYAGASGNRTKEYMNVLGEQRVDGIIGCSLPPNEEIDSLMANSNIPSILVSTLSYNYTIPYVKVDDYKAEYEATNYLIKKGHRNIAFLSGPISDVVAGMPRLQGYKQALEDNHIEFREDLVAYTSFSFETGISAFKEILSRKVDFTAVVACSDDVAAATLSVGYKHGMTVPRDFSVIGFDNTRISEMTVPPITTISQPLYEMGTIAFNMLLYEIETGVKPKSQIIPFEIVERQSVKKLR